MPPENSVQSQWYREYLQPHEPMLRGWLQNRFANRIDVDNIVQESLLRVLKAKEVNDIKSPKAFFFATARNLALDVVRRSKVVQFDSLTENELTLSVIIAGTTITETKEILLTDTTFSFSVTESEIDAYVEDTSESSASSITELFLEYTKQ